MPAHGAAKPPPCKDFDIGSVVLPLATLRATDAEPPDSTVVGEFRAQERCVVAAHGIGAKSRRLLLHAEDGDTSGWVDCADAAGRPLLYRDGHGPVRGNRAAALVHKAQNSGAAHEPSWETSRELERDVGVAIRGLFEALAKSGGGAAGGTVGASRLRQYANLHGFRGDSDDWTCEYSELCKEMGWSATSGIDQHQFEALVWRDFADSEPAETLATLRSYITALEGAAKKKPRGKAAAKAKAKAKHAAHPPHEAASGAPPRPRGKAKPKSRDVAARRESKWIARPATQALQKSKPREVLVASIFRELDTAHEGQVDAHTLWPYGKVWGFLGSAEEWLDEYAQYCIVHEWDAKAGLKPDEFAHLTSDPNGFGYATNEELLTILEELRVLKEEGGFASDDDWDEVSQAARGGSHDSVGDDTRQELVWQLFTLLDASGGGSLGSSEMRRLAEVCGFDRGPREWDDTWAKMCALNEWSPSVGCDSSLFSEFCNNSGSVGCLTDVELIEVLAAVRFGTSPKAKTAGWQRQLSGAAWSEEPSGGEAGQRPALPRYYVDNSRLGSRTAGLAYRHSPVYEDCHDSLCATWGSVVEGTEAVAAGGMRWLLVEATRMYLPMEVKGCTVVVPLENEVSSMHGWLHRRGPLSSYGWQKRFCLLEADVFEIFGDEYCHKKKGELELGPSSRAIPFSTPGAPGEADKYLGKHPFGFVIDVHPDGGKDRRMHYFDAGSVEALDGWMQAFSRRCNKAPQVMAETRNATDTGGSVASRASSQLRPEEQLRGCESGAWSYLVISDFAQVYAKPSFDVVGSGMRFGEVVSVSMRGKLDGYSWLYISGRGWSPEATKVRLMTEMIAEAPPQDLSKASCVVAHPRLRQRLPLFSVPLADERLKVTEVEAGEAVRFLGQLRALMPSGKDSSSDVFATYFQVSAENGAQGWLPAVTASGERMLLPAIRKNYTRDSGLPNMPSGGTVWVAVLPEAQGSVPLWLSPGRSSPAGETLPLGDLVEATESLMAGGMTFYKLPMLDGAWVCDVNEKGKKIIGMAVREPHRFIYACREKEGIDLREVPTRVKKFRGREMLKHRQRVAVTERITFASGDEWLKVEPPREGWVPVLHGDGTVIMVKMSPLTGASPAAASRPVAMMPHAPPMAMAPQPPQMQMAAPQAHAFGMAPMGAPQMQGYGMAPMGAPQMQGCGMAPQGAPQMQGFAMAPAGAPQMQGFGGAPPRPQAFGAPQSGLAGAQGFQAPAFAGPPGPGVPAF